MVRTKSANIAFLLMISVAALVVIQLASELQSTMQLSNDEKRQTSTVPEDESLSSRYRAPVQAVPNTPQVQEKCLSLDPHNDVDRILAYYKQVMVVMPPKASGTSLKIFANRCNPLHEAFPDNFMNGEKYPEAALLSSSINATTTALPSLMASHLMSDSTLIRLLKYSTRETLIIYMYREETERFISSIRHVLNRRLCQRIKFDKLKNLEKRIERNSTDCIFMEQDVVDVIHDEPYEMMMGNSLSCETLDSIKRYAPNIIFVHYKQSTPLQQLLAKYHCPTQEAVAINTAQVRPTTVFVRRDNATVVALDEWIRLKRNYLEYAFGSRRYTDCQGKVRQIEDQLLHVCPDQVIDLSPLGLKMGTP